MTLTYWKTKKPIDYGMWVKPSLKEGWVWTYGNVYGNPLFFTPWPLEDLMAGFEPTDEEWNSYCSPDEEAWP